MLHSHAVLADVVTETVSPGHALHGPGPAASLNEPAGHGEQLPYCPVNPGAHRSVQSPGASLPGGASVPGAAHATHVSSALVAAVCVEYVSAGHSAHAPT